LKKKKKKTTHYKYVSFVSSSWFRSWLLYLCWCNCYFHHWEKKRKEIRLRTIEIDKKKVQ